MYAPDDEKIKSSYIIDLYPNTDLEMKFDINPPVNKPSTANRKKVNLG